MTLTKTQTTRKNAITITQTAKPKSRNLKILQNKTKKTLKTVKTTLKNES